MDGIHDLGGMQGFGPIDVNEKDEPFHHPWEARMWAISRTCGAPDWTIDWWRHIRECVDPVDYLTRPYFDSWMQTYAAGYVTSGLFTVAEIASGHTETKNPPPPPRGLKQVLEDIRKSGRDFSAPAQNNARFKVGDRIRTIAHGPDHHTRLPRYARGHIGVIKSYWGSHLFADLGAKGIHQGQHLYSVEFTARELWGETADPRDTIALDLWEDYLVAP